MKIKLLILTVIIMLTAMTEADAQNRHRRIKQGVRSGEITRMERQQLAKQQRHTRREVRRAKSDGIITHRERREIRQDKRQTSRSVYRKKHNRRNRI